MKNIDKLMALVSPVILVVAGILILGFLITNNTNIGKDNNVYVRYVACILSVEPAKVTDAVISGCWDHVTQEIGREVHRYNDANYEKHFWLRD